MLPALIGAGALTNAVGSYFNYQNQKDQIKWQKQQWEQQKQREDNSVLRRAQDLEKAGFNRILAAGGQGATTSSAPILSAPQANVPDLTKTSLDYINAITQQQQIAKSQADIELIRDQQNLIRSNTNLSNMQSLKTATEVPKIKADQFHRIVEANTLQHDLNIAQQTGMPIKGGDLTPAGLAKTAGGAALRLKQLNELAEKQNKMKFKNFKQTWIPAEKAQ